MRHCKKHISSIQGSFGVGLNSIWVTVGQCHNRFATQLTKRHMVTVIILQNNLNRTETGHCIFCEFVLSAEVLRYQPRSLKRSQTWNSAHPVSAKHHLYGRCTNFLFNSSTNYILGHLLPMVDPCQTSNIPPVTIQNLHLQQAGKVAGGLKCYVENMAKHCEPHHFSKQNWSMKSKSTYIFPHPPRSPLSFFKAPNGQEQHSCGGNPKRSIKVWPEC